MARQKTTILTGKVANLIYYEFRGKPCCRSMPDKVKQTKATKQAAKDFGKAVRLSKLFRKRLTAVLPDPVDKPMMYRFNSVLRKWIHAGQPASNKEKNKLSFLSDFQFNQKCRLKESINKPFKVMWTEPGKIYVDIPELKRDNISAPKGTQTIQCNIAAISCKVNEPATGRLFKTSVDIDYRQLPATPIHIEMPFVVKPGELTLVVVGIKYIALQKGEPEEITDYKWLPAGIAGAYFEKAN